MSHFLSQLFANPFFQSAIAIICHIIAYFVIKFILKKVILGLLGRTKKRNLSEKRRKTYLTTINSFIKYILTIIATLVILQIFGVDVASLAAGLGVVGIVVGFALKDSLADIVMGKNILTDNFFNVGDVIEFGNNTGKVTRIGLRRTELKDIYNDEKIVISNRNIENVIVLGSWFDIILPTPYEKTMRQMQPIIDEIIEQFKSLDGAKDATCRGIKRFSDSSVDYCLRIFCKPEQVPGLNYAAHAIVKQTLDRHRISIPYQQIDIHQAK